MQFTNEQFVKAKAAKSVEELLALAKENGIALKEEEAAKYYAELNKEGEIADEELDNVASGCGKDVPEPKYAIDSMVICYANWSDIWWVDGREYKEGEWVYTLESNGHIIYRSEWQIVGYKQD